MNHGLVILIMSLAAAGCQNPVNTSASTQSVANKVGIWPKKILNVCFGKNEDVALTDDQKKRVTSMLSREFTQEQTGVSFSGFGWCEDAEDVGFGSDVRVYKAWMPAPSAYTELFNPKNYEQTKVEFPGIGYSVGVGSQGKQTGFGPIPAGQKAIVKVELTLPEDCAKGEVDPDDCWEFVAAHEFGHALGLRHEHLRAESANDPNCRLKKSQESLDKEDRLGAVDYGLPYDPSSVMNNCHLGRFREGRWQPGSMVNGKWTPLQKNDPKRRLLSDGDRAILKKMYN